MTFATPCTEHDSKSRGAALLFTIVTLQTPLAREQVASLVVTIPSRGVGATSSPTGDADEPEAGVDGDLDVWEEITREPIAATKRAATIPNNTTLETFTSFRCQEVLRIFSPRL